MSKDQPTFSAVKIIVMITVVTVVSVVFAGIKRTSPSEIDILTSVVVDAVHGEPVDIELLLHVNDHIAGNNGITLNRLKEAGVTDQQIQTLKSRKFRVNLEP